MNRFCDSWLVSLAHDDFAYDVFVLHGEGEAFSLAALACVALFSHRQVLFVFVHAASKTALSLAFVRFWCFLVHSIHSGTSSIVSNKLQEENSSIPRKCYRSVRIRMRTSQSTKIEMAS